MADATNDTELQTLNLYMARLLTLFTCIQPTKPTGNSVVAERTTHRIAHLIREGSDARHLCNIGFHAKLFCGQGTLSGTPTFAIDKDRGVEFVEFSTDGIHRLDVVTAHQVETEAVNAVFVIPILHRLNHKLTHHRLFGCGLVTTA